MDLIRFVEITMEVIPIEPDQIVYLTIGLMELFRVYLKYLYSKGNIRTG